jgi:hypothetical protein
MRRIEIIEGVRVRFPGRDENFDLGVEIGALTALMAMGEAEIHRTVSRECVEQLRPIANRFRYLLAARDAGDMVEIGLRHVSRRPQLRLISSR